ncbi:uncharacterized protein LOC125497821 [Beta vulgaris subsp. vulgaris]|uniref:uncharacterized protein LOC125497821 n=1 Tax=Beta vulgaris subsp. vulgaris TaxID=3555 RepID=UPI0025496D7E|nr:uncharacterized protein LOC125497821 [Beta vulgaris subsp. vulgaris]
MGLKFVAPTVVDGVSIAKLEKAEVDKMNEIWMNAVIVYVVGQNPTLTALKSFIMANWNLGNEPQMFKHEEGYFVVKMGSREGRDDVIFAGPHLFYGKPMIVKPWTASFNFHNEVLKVIPIWIKLPNLPLNCWSEDSLSRIGSLIGVPLYADECTSKALRVSFARILVEMDVTREVKKMVKIADPNGQTIVQPVLYDWLPAYCKKCNAVGHNCEAKVNRMQKVPQKQWVPKKDKVVQIQEVDEAIQKATKEDEQAKEMEAEGGWKVVTRKTKDKGKLPMYASRMIEYSNHQDPGRTGGAKGPNPYLS